ncbi:glycosyl hydrolase family 3 C-terminal domain-containing protein [Fusarium redolens]|uniref:beta-glucosidase n=1 Tax=Fusarium redolens TaxID=48865 RepID=A0A9P9KUY0_FUSRE|nr:glycosyl hydrolase family 3 C-terminal domain-containing protein [Fusarium redolens]KAH7268996.1 glycosyl hydrolase family 3 C-terminal domain-containing protein [Fusarium redolens]
MTYACQNSKTLNGLLKGELGFQGYVVSDWGGTQSTANSANSVQDMEQPGAGMLLGGRTESFSRNLTLAVENRTVASSRLDGMVMRIMTPRFYLGQDSSDCPLIDPSSADLNKFDPSTVKEKWPLGGEKNRVVRGNRAELIRGGSGSGRLTYVISPLEAIKAWAKPAGSLVQYITDNKQILAQSSGGFSTGAILNSIYPVPDVCFVFLEFDLNNNGTAFINRVAGSCANTIVVTNSGSPNMMPCADHENITAILVAHLPGEQSGNAVLDVITGVYNPSSKLPFAIAYNETDYNARIAKFTAMNIKDPNGPFILHF